LNGVEIYPVFSIITEEEETTMTRKDYVAFAAKLRTIPNKESRGFTASVIADVCADDNPNFSYDRFFRAAELEEK